MIEARAARSLDVAAVEQLTRELMTCVRDHYHRRPTSRATAREVLNAAAVVVAVIFAAARVAGGEDDAREFFELALEQQLTDGESPTTLAELDKAVKQ